MGFVRGLMFSLVIGSGLVYYGFPVSLVALVVVFLAVRSAFAEAGGWPEAMYRLRGIDYYQFYIFLPNKRIARPIIKASDLKIGSAARFSFQIAKDKIPDYYPPTSADSDSWFANPHGAPAAMFNWDDARPIRVMGTEPDAVRADGTRVPKAKIDPILIHKAYENDLLERRAKANVKTSNLKWGLFGFLIIVAVILSGIAIYESIYYGVNIACAVHAKGGSCP